MIKSKLNLIIILLWSLTVLAFFHKGSFDKTLRHTRVAEGNISKAIYHIWSKGFKGYIDILRDDAKIWGRVRPVHWLYYQIPFLITIFRNGDAFEVDRKIPLRDRMNGDLQTHVFFLIGSLAVATGFILWAMLRLGAPLWFLMLFPIYLASSETIQENLLIYYADSQEIPQLLFICLYFIGIRKIFLEKLPNKKQEIFASILLLLTYGTKETSIVLFPVMGLLLLFHIFSPKYRNTIFRKFCIRHFITHFILSFILLTLVLFFRSGAYVSKNYIYHLKKEQLIYVINTFANSLPILKLLLIELLIFIGMIILEYAFIGHKQAMTQKTKKLILCAAIFMSYSLFFCIINLPWRVRLIKYFLPTHFFIALTVLLLQIIIYEKLLKNKMYFGVGLWVIGSSIFMLKDIQRVVNRMDYIYRRYYEYRESVPIISRDIARSISLKHRFNSISIVSNYNFQEGALPFLRWLNQSYLLNVSNKKGFIVNHVKAPEKNYFRAYNGRPSIYIGRYKNLPEKIISDVVYLIYNRIPRKIKRELYEKGFIRNKRWKTRNKRTRIEKYIRM